MLSCLFEQIPCNLQLIGLLLLEDFIEFLKVVRSLAQMPVVGILHFLRVSSRSLSLSLGFSIVVLFSCGRTKVNVGLIVVSDLECLNLVHNDKRHESILPHEVSFL